MPRVVLSIVVSLAALVVIERGAAAQAPAAERPNILLAIADDQSYPHASAYGSSMVDTPAFDRVAREGLLFNNVFAASPGCSPCRAALLTGRHCWQIEDAGTHASSFPKKYVTYPDLLEEAGYFVGYTGKGWGPGNYRISGRDRNPAGPSFSKRKTKPPYSGMSSTDYAANFEDFLAEKPDGQPFCFWYGAHEPHRRYEKGSGLDEGKKLDEAEVPPFLPGGATSLEADTHDEVRSDLLDYAVEIEWFDTHLGRMLAMLDEAGELDNTLILVTADNGMPFPRAKANCYEYGIHMPLAIRWGRGIETSGRTIDDLVGFVDLTATILDAAGIEHPSHDYPPSGRSIRNLLESDKSGIIDPAREAVFSSRERHSSSRWNNLTYPIRSMRTHGYLYIRNFRPERWPAGAPQKFDKPGKLGPEHGGYHDIDACPTLDYLIEHRDEMDDVVLLMYADGRPADTEPGVGYYFHLAVDRRPGEELYDINSDPGCLNNLADDPDYATVKERLAAEFESYLRETGDPRVTDGGDIYESYIRYSPIRQFPKPDWAE